MDKLLLRGYVTPEDFGGDVQQALNTAAELDTRKVILDKDYPCAPLTVPAYTHLIVNGTLQADLRSEHTTGWNFEQDRFYLEGSGKVVGDLTFFNTRRAVLNGLRVEGSVTFLFSRDMRMEHCTVTGAIQVGRGCASSIFQYLTAGSFAISQEIFDGDIVLGKDPTIQNIILRDSVMTDGSVTLVAEEAAGLMNVQADHITAPDTAVVLGKEGASLPPERYFNLTFTDLTAPEKLLQLASTKHMYLEL